MPRKSSSTASNRKAQQQLRRNLAFKTQNFKCTEVEMRFAYNVEILDLFGDILGVFLAACRPDDAPTPADA